MTEVDGNDPLSGVFAGYGRMAALEKDNPEVAQSGHVAPFTFAQVEYAQLFVRSTGMVEKIAEWRAENLAVLKAHGQYRPGGRPATVGLTDEHILIGMFLLAREHSELWVRTLARVFQMRLTDQARAHLNLRPITVKVNETDTEDERLTKMTLAWVGRTDRALHSLLDTMDAYPAPRRLMNLAERMHEEDKRKRNSKAWNLTNKRRNKDDFAFAFTEATMRLVDPAQLDQWGGSVSIDQTTVEAASSRGPSKKERTTPGADSLVMEMDAGWAVKDPGRRGQEDAEHKGEATFGYKVNFAVMVPEEPRAPSPHPNLIAGMSVSTPNKEVAQEAVRMLIRLKEAGYKTGRVTTDKEYAANFVPENYYFPVTALGYTILTDYQRPRLGVMGGQRGALIVDGAYVCPMMPKKLQTLNVDHVDILKRLSQVEDETGIVNPDLREQVMDNYDKQLAEAKKYHFRVKQAADENGAVKMMCPAAGISPTAICPLKKRDDVQVDEKKVVILNGPKHPDDVCVQQVTTMELIDESRWLQPIQYMSKEWRDKYSFERNGVEGKNRYIKTPGKEGMGDAGLRLVRGLTAQAFLITFLVVSNNFRAIESFRKDQATKPVTTRKKAATKASGRARTIYNIKHYEPTTDEVRQALGLGPKVKGAGQRLSKRMG